MLRVDVVFQKVESPRRVARAIELVRDPSDLARYDVRLLRDRRLDLVQRQQRRKSFQPLGKHLVRAVEMKAHESRRGEGVRVSVILYEPVLEGLFSVAAFVDNTSVVVVVVVAVAFPQPPGLSFEHARPPPTARRREDDVLHEVCESGNIVGFRELAGAVDAQRDRRARGHFVAHEDDLQSVREDYVPIGSRGGKGGERTRDGDDAASLFRVCIGAA
mmetsp:Transcript_17741/g.42746  ORF Transcript_17741/g.42746 Transcript_17741/m.42746 type:complete len:217 (+) Transcript_17741:747-1397(+)